MEVFLSLLPSNFSVQGVSPGNAASGVTQTPSVLASLPPGTLLRGYVLTRDAKGNPVLRTGSGDFLIESKFFLKIGSDVVARIEATGRQFRASILSVDGLNPKEAENIPAHGTDADVIVRTGESRTAPSAEEAARAAPRPGAPPSAVLTGTLVRPAEAQASPLPAGTQMTFRLINAVPTAAQQVTAASGLPGLVVPATPVTKPSSAPLFPGSPDAGEGDAPVDALPLRPSASFTQQYGAYTRLAAHAPVEAPPAVPGRTSAAVPGSGLPSGLVQGEVLTGGTLLQTPLGTVRLDQASAFPPGTRLGLEVLNVTTAQSPRTPEIPAAVVQQLSQRWEALSQIVSVLTQMDTEEAAHFIKTALPTTGAFGEAVWHTLHPTAQNLNAGLFFFLAALNGGTFRGWLGERAARKLEEQGHGALIKQAEGDFAVLRALHADVPQQWQALFLPVLTDGELRMLRFYTKRERREQGRNRPAQGDTRFIIETELTQLGPLQLDGLVRKNDGATQFDLIIRSHIPFSGEAQRDIQAIYTTIGEATGYRGMVLFQEVQDFPVRPLDEILSGPHREVMA